MAVSVGRPRRGAIADINVTPMADVIEVTVRGDGAVLVAGAVVPAALVGDWVAAMPPARRATVLVQADRELPYTDVARVLAGCRTAGVAEVALATQRKVGP